MDKKEKDIFQTYSDQINIWYKVHNVIREKTELYYDFLFSLFTLIDETYLGSDVIETDEDISNHFKWCLNNVIENFEHEKIYFNYKNGQFDYLYRLFYQVYYQNENNEQDLLNYFKVLFTYNKIKTRDELDEFIKIYKMFDDNLKKIN